MCLKQYFSQEMDYDLDRFFLKNTGPDHVLEIREKMRELMGMIIRQTISCDFLCPDGKRRWEDIYVEPPEGRTTSRALGLLRRAL